MLNIDIAVYTNSTEILATPGTLAIPGTSVHSAPAVTSVKSLGSFVTSSLFGTSIISAPPSVNTSICAEIADCVIGAPALTWIFWVSVTYQTTITAGTVYYVTQNGTNSTRYSTSHASTQNVTQKHAATNAGGTATTKLHIGSSNIQLTYPSSYVHYNTIYEKYTKQPNVTGCQSSYDVTLSSSKTIANVDLPAQGWATPPPEDVLGEDWRAHVYTGVIEEDWARSAYPSERDFMTCGALGWLPTMRLPPIFLTEVSTLAAATVYATQTCNEPCGATSSQKQTNSLDTAIPTHPPAVLDSMSSLAVPTGPNIVGGAQTTRSTTATTSTAESTASDNGQASPKVSHVLQSASSVGTPATSSVVVVVHAGGEGSNVRLTLFYTDGRD